MESEGKDDDQHWDGMSDTDRIAHLKSTLSDAFDAMDAGDVSQPTIANAEDALTNLRSHLYKTESGRAEYEELEEKLLNLENRQKE